MIIHLDFIDKSDYWLVYIILIIVFFLSVIFIIILGFRISYVVNHPKRIRFTSTMYGLLSMALNHPEKQKKYVKRLNSLIHTKWQKELLLDALLDCIYSFSGVYADRAQELYKHFDLDKYSEKKIKSSSWSEIIEGIIEISVSGSPDAYKKILPFVDHKEIEVRKHSKIAIVELGKIKGLIDMDERMGIMSSWTFISINSILHRHPFSLTKEQYAKLEKSKNPATRRLAKYLDRYTIAH